MAKIHENKEIISFLRDDVKRWQSSCDQLRLENNELCEENQIKSEKLNVYDQQLVEISNRVLSLEHHQVARASQRCVIVSPAGPKVKYIQNFANALFPHTERQERLKELFNVMYESRKSVVFFGAKGRLQRDTQLLCSWKILEVLDGSKQSLNQVSFILVLL